jgi:hypothetical protein
MSKKRKCDEDYVLYGVTCINERDGTKKSQCFLCRKILAHGSMKPAKLKKQLMSVNPENGSKDVFFFRVKKAIKKSWATSKTWICYFTKTFSLKHPIKLFSGLPNKISPILLERL